MATKQYTTHHPVTMYMLTKFKSIGRLVDDIYPESKKVHKMTRGLCHNNCLATLNKSMCQAVPEILSRI